MKFNSETQNLLVQHGKLEDDKSRRFIRKSLGLGTKKVEATKHAILSGPPGVGKTYGTRDECNKNNVIYFEVPPGTSDIAFVTGLAFHVYTLPANKDLVVILDDADDVVFGDYQTLNKWKIACGGVDYDAGIIPSFNHPVSMNNTLSTLRKQKGKEKMVEAIESFMSEDSIGVSIPTDRVRFVILCNLDLEDPGAFGRNKKLRSAIGPVLDRFEYKRIELNWDTQWGWLAYTLSNSQPFKEHPLKVEQKKVLLDWMFSNWKNLRSTSYRTVEKLAAAMINEPDNYLDEWAEQLGTKNEKK
jgi:hypothetical protein